MANEDPRFFGVADGKAVKFGSYFKFDNLAYMQAGEYGDPVVETGDYQEFHSLWVKITGATGRAYGHRIHVERTGLTGRTSQAIRAEITLSHASGHAAAGGSAIHAAAYLGTGNDGHADLMSGLSATIEADSETRSLQGTYAALVLQTEFKANNTMPATTSFIYAADAGTVKAPAFIHWGQAPAAGTAFLEKTATTITTKCIVVNVNGVYFYVPLYTTAA